MEIKTEIDELQEYFLQVEQVVNQFARKMQYDPVFLKKAQETNIMSTLNGIGQRIMGIQGSVSGPKTRRFDLQQPQ